MVGAVLAGLLGLAPGAHAAGSDPARAEESRAPSEARAPEQATLLLSIRARALGLIQDTAPDDGLEPMRAPTGEGRSQMPSATTEIARGVYLTVMPACLPGVDEPLLPSPYGRRTVPPSRRR
jgi:hypothetical protein